ncbi:ArsR family transcriptional regulator [Jezberella montanilacus]|uniref:ArsR family transcriptional regulator n=1 Tax=Jezberella montanilacus TaxID=323426 RepID=A0A2T0XJ60_9BURK|nr:metalloregulator ArsR/SmtB family transcription factor [Jezberella montanilacus]PRY98976.1 ArsR family transcriptional regulator [Jezberella montanilacus]
MKSKNAISALLALAQESRLVIFRTLVQVGPSGMSAGKIGQVTEIAPSSISFHMKELVNAEMVTARKDGRFIIYTANFDTMSELIAFLTENCCGGNPCLSTSTQTCVTI